MTYFRTKKQERRFRELGAAYREDDDPGTTTPTQAIAKAEEAIVHLVRAARLLEEARDLSTWATGRADFAHFAERVQETLSCDHDEAGLQPLLRLLRQRTH